MLRITAHHDKRSSSLPLVVIGLTVLCVAGSPAPADTISWTGACGNELWTTCCDITIGQDPYKQNNWSVAPTPAPNCPPLPSVTDDVVIGPANVTLTGSGSAGTLTAGGIFTLEGGLTIWTSAVFGGLVQWNSGELRGPNGAIVSANGGIDLAGSSGHTLRTVTLNNPNTALVTGTGTLWLGNETLQDPAVFENWVGAMFDVQTDADLLVPGAEIGIFDNAGTFLKSGGGVTRVQLTQFNNSGSVIIQNGTLEVGSGTSTGSFQVNPLTTLRFISNQSLEGTAQITSGGLVVNAGLRIQSPAVISVPFFNNEGMLGGTGELQVTNTMNWTDGGMTETGTTTIPSGASVFVTGSSNNKGLVDGRTFNNAGTVTWGGTGWFVLDRGAVLNNQAGATFVVQTDSVFAYIAAPRGTINNAGLFVKSAGAGTTIVNPHFNNTGILEIQSGTLQFGNGDFTQTAGETLVNGILKKTTIGFQGGVLTGAGTVQTNLTNTAATVRPGASVGVLTVMGNYTQAVGGTLDVEVGGRTQGAEFDLLSVTGTASLNGALNVTLVNGFVPSFGDTFTILTSGGRSGAFSTVTATNLPAYLHASVVYSASSATLVIQPAFVPGDVNCDAVVDVLDLQPFVLALTDPAGYVAAHPLCDINRADMNGDLAVNGADIQDFTQVLLGS